MHRIKQLGFNAIKESFDRLPTGVCFFDRTGSIVLCNRQMYQLSRYLLDSDMQYLGEVQEALSAPGGGIVRIPDIDNTYRFPDNTVWRFEKRRSPIGTGRGIYSLPPPMLPTCSAPWYSLPQTARSFRRTRKN